MTAISRSQETPIGVTDQRNVKPPETSNGGWWPFPGGTESIPVAIGPSGTSIKKPHIAHKGV